MIVVIDASAAYDLLTEARCANKIAGVDELIAPDLIVAELLNARWKVIRSKFGAPSLDLTLELLGRLHLMPALPYASDAARLSEKLDHPVYDCLYVAMAQRTSAKLLTMDERVSKKVKAAGLSKLLQL